MSSELSTTTAEGLRERAVKRLKKKHDFHVHLVIYLMVNALLVAVWAMTSTGFFWPIFPMVGWGVGVVANAWDAYGRDVPTESQIRREMEKLDDR
ncbi:2TM domain-containing protein [Nocardioides sp.]|uniref:2TM domain-containing protein n=1 Tax=Nocardioides sp. TaxID=35761 RepID=UPI003D0A86F3